MSSAEKMANLLASKDGKLESLSQKTYSNDSLSGDTYTDMGDGYVENNGNKIWGISEDWTPQENAFALDYLYQNHSLPTEARGDRRLYEYGVKEEGKYIDPNQAYQPENYDPRKIGASSGRFNSSDYRYQPGRAEAEGLTNIPNGWESGTSGVDVKNKYADRNLAYAATTAGEALFHSNKNAIQNRLLRQRDDGLYDYASPQGMVVIDKAKKDELFGSGASEYYVNHESMFDDNYDPATIDQAKIIAGINKAMAIVAGDKYEVPVTTAEAARYSQELDAKYSDTSELGQTIAAVPAGIGKGALDLVDALQEGITYLPQLAARAYTGDANLDIDLFNDKYKKAATDYIDSAVGYDRAHDEKTLDKVTKEFEATGIDITSWESIKSGISDPEKLARLSAGALEFLTNPSLTVGMFTEIIGSGLVFGAATKAGVKILSKVAPYAEKVVSSALKSNVTKIKEEVGAAAASGNTARMLELQNSYTLAKMIPDLLKGSVYTNADMMVRMNNDITAYIENNNDEVPDAGKLFQMAVLNRIVSSAEVMSLKSLAGIKDIPPAAAKEATRRGIVGATGEVLGTVFKIGMGGLQEGTQEFFDTVVEQLNQKVDAADFENQSIGEILSAASAEILTGAFAGAAGGVHMKTGSTTLSAVGLGAQKLGSLRSALPGTTGAAPGAVANAEVPATEDEVASAKAAYGKLLNRLSTETTENKVNAANIGTYLDDIDELSRTKHIISTSSPDKVAQGEAMYNKVIDHLEEFIKNNPNVVLTKKINRKTVASSLKDKEFQDRVDAISPEGQKAIQQAAAAIGDGDLRDIKPALGFLTKQLKTGTYESIVQDEEAMAPYLKNLERTLTGTTSGDLVTTFANVQAFFQSGLTAKPTKAAGNTASSVTSGVLGSSPTSEFTLEEGDYDDYGRSVDAERVVQTLLGSGRTYDEDFTGKLMGFARRNGVKESALNRIIKSFASVDEEAKKGARGYETRLTRLKGLVESSNPDKRAIQKEAEGLSSMEEAVAESAQQLANGITGAINEAALMNKQANVGIKLKKFPTEYIKNDKKPYLIYIRKGADGKWAADVKDAKMLQATKEGYAKDIKREMSAILSRADTKIPGVVSATNTYKVPVVAGPGKDVRISDSNYIKSVSSTLEKVGLPRSINKVILGGKTSKKWSRRGDYYKANKFLVNSEEFSDEDVVLVNSLDTIKKGEKFSLPGLFSSKKAKPESLTDAQKSFAAAVEAGATIVLDKDMLGKDSFNAKEALVRQLVDKNGYKGLEGYNSYVFVKQTEDNKALIAKHAAELKLEKDEKDLEAKSKTDLVMYARSLDTGVNYQKGVPLTPQTRKIVQDKYDAARATVKKKYFSDNDEKLTSYITRELVDQVKVEVTKILKDPNPVPLDYKDKSLEKAIEKAIASEEQKDATGNDVLKEWKNFVEVEGLTGKARESKIKQILAKLGTEPKALVNKIISKEHSFGAGKNVVYELIYQNVKTGDLAKPKMSRTMLSASEVTKQQEGHVFGGQKHILLSVRPVEQDPTKLVSVTNTTILNSMPVESLPFAIRDSVKSFTADAFKALEKVMPAELADQTDDKINGKFQDGNFNLYNSPARGLIFNKDGKPNPEVLAAMYLAIGDLLKSDMGKMTRGYKTDADLAQLFGVQEFEVTDDMRDFARKHGVFLKTVASSVGKTVLSQLGLSKRVGDDIAKGEFEALVADLGNSAILIAEQQGILVSTDEKSNKVATLYRDGEVRKDDSKVHFIHVKDKEVTKNGYPRKEPADSVKAIADQFTDLAEAFPEAVLGRKGGYFTPPDADRLNKAKTEIRNDVLGLEVPRKAQEALELLMNTEYEFDMERITAFLSYVDAPGSKVKEVLGFIDPNSPKFDEQLNKDKEVQEGKNRDIEKSIEELRLLKDKIEKSGKVNPSLYFDYYFTGNQRYNLDSNTVDPMTDKLHRFLTVPKLHRMKYNVSKYDGGAIKFEATSSTGTSDQSYTVRLAIAQALGQGVDKLNAISIIQFADAALGMSSDMLAEAKQGVLDTGKYEFTDKYGVVRKIAADHLSHTLQAFDFIEKFKAGGDFESNLSLEFDALTSGFANKVQQMPILKNMKEHLARTGVLTEEYQRFLRQHLGFGGAGVSFDPSQGHAISDVLHAGNSIAFFDSYQNLARTVIKVLAEGKVQNENLTKTAVNKKGMSGMGVFNAIKPLLPGGEFVVSGAEPEAITGALRNLFKEPFMIFNYSAGIKRIITNLGIGVANDLAREIATFDFNVDNHEDVKDKQKAIKIKEVATNLINSVELTNPDTKSKVKTAEELQKLLRAHKLRALKIKPFKVDNKAVGNNPANLEDLMENIVRITYGEVVQAVFEEEFKPFIEVQDAMNDSFKVGFRIFDQKRMKALNNIRKNNAGKPLTVADHANVLEDLWDDFPWIVGPLTGSDSKGNVARDVIAVSSSSTRSPRPVEQARVSPQTHLGTAHSGTMTRTVTPLIRYLEEAQRAGSVLPFHGIDGAEMGSTIVEMAMAAFIAVHDASIPPLDQSDMWGFTYNRNKSRINGGDYVLADALQGVADRLRKTIKGERFEAEFKDTSAKSLNALEKGDTFITVANRVLENLDMQVKIIKDAREEYYGENGLMKGAVHGNMSSPPGGSFIDGQVEPNLNYKKVFEKLYDTGVELPTVKKEAAVETTAMVDETNNMTSSINRIDSSCRQG